MSFCPAGAEDSDSDEGFYMGSSFTAKYADRDKSHSMNGDINLNSTPTSQKNFTAMPAGAESDDEGSEGFDLSAARVYSFSSSSARNDGRKPFDRQCNKTNDSNASHPSAGASGLGRGRGQLQQRGRGRGGFPRPPSSYSNRGKTTRRFVYNSYEVTYYLLLSNDKFFGCNQNKDD